MKRKEEEGREEEELDRGGREGERRDRVSSSCGFLGIPDGIFGFSGGVGVRLAAGRTIIIVFLHRCQTVAWASQACVRSIRFQ